MIKSIPEIDSIIQNKYEIVFEFDPFLYFNDFLKLENDLIKIRRDVWKPNQKIIVNRFEIECYLPEINLGITLANTINCFKKIDIPLHTMLIVTNHFGLENEIEKLIIDKDDKPKVIFTLANPLDIANEYKEIDANFDQIEKHAIALMGGTERVHRHIVFNFLKDNNLLDKVATSYKQGKV